MSLLFRECPPARDERANGIDYLASLMRDAARTPAGGTYVDNDSAMRHDAVWSCITKKAQDIAMFPVDVVRYQGGTRVAVEPVPQIISAPSVHVDDLDWRYQICVSWFQAGNAWGLVTKTTPDLKYPLRIELRNDSEVLRLPNGKGGVDLWIDGRKHDLWPVGDLWHKPAYTMPGSFLGLSPIAYHRATIGLGLDAEKFGAEFFPQGGPTWIFAPEKDPGEEGAKSLKAKLIAAMRGSRDPLIIPQSVKPTQITVNPSDSQFIESQKYTVEQICRIFDEDPVDHASAGGGTVLTYANRTDNDVARLRRRQWWVTKMQKLLTELLPRPQVVRLNVDASLMMTPKERWEILDLRLKNKTIAVNGALKVVDEEPFDDPIYDEPGIPGAAYSNTLPAVAPAPAKGAT